VGRTQVKERRRDGKTDLCDIKASEIFFKYVSFYQKIKQVTTAHILQNLRA
jgi:hypothetical protein